MRARLHFDRVAPGGVTLPFLLAAPFFGLLAAGLLLLAGSDVLLSRWHPKLIGALHIYTIGFLLFSMAGALLQIGPVLTARPALQNERAAAGLRLALGAGAVLLGCGLFHGLRALLIPAAVLLAIALPGWIVIAVRGIGRSPASRGLLLAIGGLGFGMLLGLRLASGHAVPALGLPRQLTDLHAGWMLLGGVAPLVMAIGNVVIPMFQHTPALPRYTTWLPLLAVAGMLLATVGAPLAGWLVAGVALALFAFAVLRAQRQRRNAAPDPTVQLFALAMVFALAGLLAWLVGAHLPAWQHRLQWTGGVLLVMGFAGSSVHGMALRIVPFLVRLRLQRSLWQHGRSALQLPAFHDLLSTHLARMLPLLQGGAVTLLAFAAINLHPAAYFAGLVLLAAAQLCLGATLWSTVARGCSIGAQLAADHNVTTENMA